VLRLRMGIMLVMGCGSLICIDEITRHHLWRFSTENLQHLMGSDDC
jgi:hypothetical protein